MFYCCIPCLALAPLSAFPAVPQNVHDTQTVIGLIEFLGDDNLDVREEATTALVNLGPPTVPALTDALGDENKLVRIGAVKVLGSIRYEAKQSVFALAAVMQDDDQDVRLAAVNALGKIGHHSAILALVRLGDDDPDVGDAIRDALGRIGGNPRYVSELTVELHNKDEHVQEAAAYALGLIGAEAKEAVFELTAAIQDPNASVRLAAINALSDIGPVARSAVIALTRLQDDDPAICSSARDAILKIGASPELVPGLIELLREPDDGVRENAAYVLGMIGPEAKLAAMPLIAAAREGSDASRAEAARALRKILLANGNRVRGMPGSCPAVAHSWLPPSTGSVQLMSQPSAD